MTKQKRKPQLSTTTTYNRISALHNVYLDLDHGYKNSPKCAFKSGKLVYNYKHNT